MLFVSGCLVKKRAMSVISSDIASKSKMMLNGVNAMMADVFVANVLKTASPPL